MKRILYTLAAAALVSTVTPTVAEADWWADRQAARYARTMPWHGQYNHTATGSPVALIVPPTAHMQMNYGWGVTQSEMTPIYHQFRRRYPGESEFTEGLFRGTPARPSNTRQFGVYYIRGPW